MCDVFSSDLFETVFFISCFQIHVQDGFKPRLYCVAFWTLGNASCCRRLEGMEPRLARLDGKLRALYRPQRCLAGLLLQPLCCSHPAAQQLLLLLPAAASAGAASCATLPRSGPPPCSSCTWTRPNSPFLKLHRPRRKFLHIGINGILIFQGCKVATACFGS